MWRSGHIGISLDGEYAIEARGFNYGIVKTKIKNRDWTNWGMLPSSIIDYVIDSPNSSPSESSTSSKECPYEEPTKYQRKGSTGAGTKWVQWMLTQCGYSVGRCGIDGDFGKDTLAAVIQFQTDHKLEVDGIVGPMTRATLKSEFSKRKEV